ncbi:MAG: hypothetical protein U9Q70_03245 [Chloroflexota bacterium]|nr:hypothetical protein [Chloroflexota bacterium]
MKNKLWWLVIGLLIFSLACNVFSPKSEDVTAVPQAEEPTVAAATKEPAVATEEPTVATEEPTAATKEPAVATEEPPVFEGGEGFTIRVTNQSNYEICYVLISPSESEDWGEDWLGDDETIVADATRNFEVPAGSYDVKIANCDFETLTTEWQLVADETIQVGGGGQVALTLSNVSDFEICYAQLSLSSLDTWGEDALGDKESLSSGDSRIFFLSPGTYDALLSDCDEQALAEEYEIEIAGDVAWTLTNDGLIRGEDQHSMADDGGPFYLEVENAAADDVCYIYISSSDSDDWQEDWLGDGQTIASGGSWRSEYIPAGPHDIKLENCAGAVLATAWEVRVDTTMTIGGYGQAALEVINESSNEICYAYFSFSSADEWGMDWMGQFETIPAAGSTRIFYVEPGTYDLLVQDCDGNDLVTETGIDIGTDGTTWTISD